MTTTCRRFESRTTSQAHADLRTAAAERAWLEHLAVCMSCQAQVRADAALRTSFAGIPVPDPPPFLEARCAHATRLPARARPLGRRARTWLRFYWMGASAAALGIVLGLGPVVPTSSLAMGMVLATVTSVVLPAALLLHLRGNALEFVRRLWS